MENFRKKQFISIKSRIILSGMKFSHLPASSHLVHDYGSMDKGPCLCPAYPHCMCYVPINHLEAVLFIRSTVVVPQCLCSSHPYSLFKSPKAIHINSFLKDFTYLFLERGREGEREGLKHQCVVAFYTPPMGE